MDQFFNMTELMEEIKKRSKEGNKEIFSEKKIREKILELFRVMSIRTEYLQEGRKTTGQYRFPIESLDYLCYLHDFYTTSEGKLFRKGEFEKIDIEIIRNIIGQMMAMLKKCDLNQAEISNQEIIIWQSLGFIYLDSLDKIRQQIDSMTLDFFPKTKEIFGRLSGDPEHPVIQRKSRFRYSLRDLDSVDMYYFFNYVLQDLKDIQVKYRTIYGNMVDIRRKEISEKAYYIDTMFDDGDVEQLWNDADKTVELYSLLYKDPEYDALAEKRHRLIQSNEFLKKRDKELQEIAEKMSKIEKEYIDKYFNGEIDDEIDQRFEEDYEEEDPEVVLSKAIEEYKEKRDLIKKIAALVDRKKVEEEKKSNKKDSNE